MCPLSATLPDNSSVFQMACDTHWNASYARLYFGAELRAARVHPRMAECKHSVPRSAHAKLGNCHQCKRPHNKSNPSMQHAFVVIWFLCSQQLCYKGVPLWYDFDIKGFYCNTNAKCWVSSISKIQGNITCKFYSLLQIKLETYIFWTMNLSLNS